MASASSGGVTIFKEEEERWEIEKVIPSTGEDNCKVDFSDDYLAVAHGNDTVEIIKVLTLEQEKVITLPSGKST